jgi:hypothetical protein
LNAELTDFDYFDENKLDIAAEKIKEIIGWYFKNYYLWIIRLMRWCLIGTSTKKQAPNNK